jgi:outer membrane protein OmpA-like peptidoglycan-associated protein
VERFHFEAQTAALLDRCADKMAWLVAWLKEHPDTALSLRGFLDQREAERQGAALREQRAAAVREALIRGGIAADRIETSAGEPTFLCADATENCLAMNRRVEVRVRETSRADATR